MGRSKQGKNEQVMGLKDGEWIVKTLSLAYLLEICFN